jgi:hypothetical protein
MGAFLGKMRTQLCRRVPALFFLLTIALTGRAYAAGGGYSVDDAEIGKPGDCEVDSWASTASNHDFSATVNPFCVVNLGMPIEFDAIFQRMRASGVWTSTGTALVKTNLIPVENHPFGVGLVGAATWNLVTGATTGGYVYVPLTFQLKENFRINVNGGWQYDNVAKIHYATWGAGFEWIFMKPFTLIGEVYGQAGKLAAADPDDAPSPKSVIQPRVQAGIRFTPAEKIDIDVIWGHNINGENAHWLTLGVNLRF